MFVSVQTVGMIFYLASVKFLKSVKTRCPPRRSRCMSCVSDNILLSIMVHSCHGNARRSVHCIMPTTLNTTVYVSQSTRVFVYRDGHGLGSQAIHLAHHCFSFNMRSI